MLILQITKNEITPKNNTISDILVEGLKGLS